MSVPTKLSSDKIDGVRKFLLSSCRSNILTKNSDSIELDADFLKMLQKRTKPTRKKLIVRRRSDTKKSPKYLPNSIDNFTLKMVTSKRRRDFSAEDQPLKRQRI